MQSGENHPEVPNLDLPHLRYPAAPTPAHRFIEPCLILGRRLTGSPQLEKPDLHFQYMRLCSQSLRDPKPLHQGAKPPRPFCRSAFGDLHASASTKSHAQTRRYMPPKNFDAKWMPTSTVRHRDHRPCAGGALTVQATHRRATGNCDTRPMLVWVALASCQCLVLRQRRRPQPMRYRPMLGGLSIRKSRGPRVV
jgi:hypothetical protein